MANILILPGDGIGPEVVAEAVRVLEALQTSAAIELRLEFADIGGAAIDACGVPLPESALAAAKSADAVLLGAVGGPQWDAVERARRPERGLLDLRAALDVFANLRPAVMHPPLAGASTLRAEVVEDLDLLIVRELTGGIYFGQPRGIRKRPGGEEREGFNTLIYRESEIERICRVAFDIAGRRRRRLCSVDKANALETGELWREVVENVARDYPEVTLTHMYVDNAAMQLVRDPRQFDVMVTSNMFGDILSDLASMLTGSIGMLPSASIDATGKGLYEPIHGTAPDIAGKGVANPLAAILSVAMMLRHSLGAGTLADRIERAVQSALERGLRTPDIAARGGETIGTREMGTAVLEALHA